MGNETGQQIGGAMLKRWSVILLLTLFGLGLGMYWLSQPTVPQGTTPMGDTAAGTTQSVLALAGALTALGTAVFGLLGKFNDFRKAQLDIEAKKLDNEAKRRAMDRE